MKRKGFTLVELLAVITVLALIGLIAVPAITSIINNSKQKTKDIQIKEIEEHAKSWAADHAELLSEDEAYSLRVQVLIDEGYLDNEQVADPTDNKKTLNECISITYSTTYNSYEFKYTTCPNATRAE